VAAADAALRAWRLERARADKVAPFIVASNALVRAIAEAKPATAKELFLVKGMGPTKLELYGDEILAGLDSVT
jgi:superfamily II DNA helicase RecQ